MVVDTGWPGVVRSTVETGLVVRLVPLEPEPAANAAAGSRGVITRLSNNPASSKRFLICIRQFRKLLYQT